VLAWRRERHNELILAEGHPARLRLRAQPDPLTARLIEMRCLITRLVWPVPGHEPQGTPTAGWTLLLAGRLLRRQLGRKDNVASSGKHSLNEHLVDHRVEVGGRIAQDYCAQIPVGRFADGR
jgi:hypothetical protein